ncbi:unnamed protein product [Caenorhabditis bovis]|uniref:peptidylglycine monooxygenase n=1 Tax=Caenorhabditis bovis TaxID=2654633 RepID=A0A8S1EW44_9PELO|nr:unnamed protein product [Caenorhabditis bovis]
MNSVKCYNCLKTGHISNNCPGKDIRESPYNSSRKKFDDRYEDRSCCDALDSQFLDSQLDSLFKTDVETRSIESDNVRNASRISEMSMSSRQMPRNHNPGFRSLNGVSEKSHPICSPVEDDFMTIETQRNLTSSDGKEYREWTMIRFPSKRAHSIPFLKRKSPGMLAAMSTFLILIVGFLSTDALKTQFLMPGVIPEAETYLCTSVELSENEDYLVGFEAVNEEKNVHHILLFGCEEPGSDEPVWDCGEMSKPMDGMPRAPTCGSKPAILYAWAHDAPPLKLPKDVGFRVGGNTPVRHLVMQVHYMHDKPNPDASGVEITYTVEPQPKLAATMLLVTGGVLPANKTEKFETACVIEEDVVMHPFAYRTHTHRHGVDVSGWIVKEDENGDDHWTLIGRRDPQKPQMFVPVDNSSLVISQGDMVTARCILKNNENRDIAMGATGEDEMCNLYVMYWTDGDVMEDNTCFSPGAPNYRWSSEAALNHIPA